MKCPSCGKEFESAPTKKWKFRFYDVERFKCPDCGKGIMAYSAPGKRTWTVPKPKA
jgi:endogenous inhibitor of DNA gyrase (YacG/DUF329 family)